MTNTSNGSRGAGRNSSHGPGGAEGVAAEIFTGLGRAAWAYRIELVLLTAVAATWAGLMWGVQKLLDWCRTTLSPARDNKRGKTGVSTARAHRRGAARPRHRHGVRHTTRHGGGSYRPVSHRAGYHHWHVTPGAATRHLGSGRVGAHPGMHGQATGPAMVWTPGRLFTAPLDRIGRLVGSVTDARMVPIIAAGVLTLALMAVLAWWRVSRRFLAALLRTGRWRRRLTRALAGIDITSLRDRTLGIGWVSRNPAGWSIPLTLPAGASWEDLDANTERLAAALRLHKVAATRNRLDGSKVTLRLSKIDPLDATSGLPTTWPGLSGLPDPPQPPRLDHRHSTTRQRAGRMRIRWA